MLKNPIFKEYHIYFVTDISDQQLRKLAEHDEYDLIRKVMRIFMCYQVHSNEMFSLGIDNI